MEINPYLYFDHGQETDPMLGYRSIRILLEHPDIFVLIYEPLSAAQRGNIKILFPMIAHYEDVLHLKKSLKNKLLNSERFTVVILEAPPIGAKDRNAFSHLPTQRTTRIF